MSQNRTKARARRAARVKAREAAERLHETSERRRLQTEGAFLRQLSDNGHLQASAAFQEEVKKQEILNRMTGWQRNQCMKACGGDIRSMAIGQMQIFAAAAHNREIDRAQLGQEVDFGQTGVDISKGSSNV